MAWQKHTDPFCIDITAIWGLLHRWIVMGPSSGASVALLWAVTFVPEWNFDSFLFLCCCCFLSFFVLFAGVCPLCTYADASLDIYPIIVKPSQDFLPTNHHGKGDIWIRRKRRAKRRWRESLWGKQESREMNAPSGHFSSIHQLPGCTPKIEKPLFLFLLSPRQALSMCKCVIVLKTSCVFRRLVSINPFVGIVCS